MSFIKVDFPAPFFPTIVNFSPYGILTAGQGMVQGIFFEFGIVEDDDVTEERNGGFGSTTK